MDPDPIMDMTETTISAAAKMKETVMSPLTLTTQLFRASMTMATAATSPNMPTMLSDTTDTNARKPANATSIPDTLRANVFPLVTGSIELTRASTPAAAATYDDVEPVPTMCNAPAAMNNSADNMPAPENNLLSSVPMCQ